MPTVPVSISLLPGRGVGADVRLRRIFNAHSGRTLIVPMDQSVTIGALGDSGLAERTVAMLSRVGANAVVVHKGRLRAIDPAHFGSMALIVHLSAGTDLSLDPNCKVAVGSVEECASLGADAVSVHVNVGSPTEAMQLDVLGSVAAQCDRFGLPLLAMMYARGPEITDGNSTRTLSHLAAIAVDVGADMVKLNYAGEPQAMREVVATCPIPIVVAGRPSHVEDCSAIAFADEVIGSGVAGLSFGRSIFHARDPERVARAIVRRLHPHARR